MAEAAAKDVPGSLGYWGWALIACAFIKPVAEAMGGGNAFQAGERIGQLAAAFVACVLVLGIAMRKSSVRAKNIARIVVGVILMVIACLPAAAEVSKGATVAEKQFLQESQVLAARHMADSQQLAKRFDAIDLDSMLSPETLASPAGIASLRKAVVSYKALLDDRMKMLYSQQADFETFFNTRSPSEADKKAALAAFEPGKQRNVALYSGLDKVQRQFADAVSELVEWSAKQAGHWSVVAGKFQFDSTSQQQQFLMYANKVQTAESDVNSDIVAGTATQKQMQADAEKYRAVQREMLAK